GSHCVRWSLCLCRYWWFFFFQAEDGIRDRNVTGVQTCALPIYQPGGVHQALDGLGEVAHIQQKHHQLGQLQAAAEDGEPAGHHQDRKSTRLNSSHVSISYAVFCLKKKKRSNSTARSAAEDT